MGLIHYGLIGAGGHGREVMPLFKRMIEALPSADSMTIDFVIEGDVGASRVNGINLISLTDFLALPGRKMFNVAIADSRARERIANKCINAGAVPINVISENAYVLDCNTIGDGCILSPFSMVTSNVTIGKHFHANMYSYVAHDCIVGDYVTFAPRVGCNGHVTVEDHAYIGTGAVIRPGSYEKQLVIGRGAVVGMGAVVTSDVPPFSKVVGNPARLVETKNC